MASKTMIHLWKKYTKLLIEKACAEDCDSSGRGFEPHQPPQSQCALQVSSRSHSINFRTCFRRCKPPNRLQPMDSFIPKNPAKHMFWSKAEIKNPDECWSWCGAISKNGYGCYAIGRTRASAHRVAYEIGHKKRIPAGLVVRHKCDNKKCVNPSHLEIGTSKENSQDMVSRGRANNGCRIGENNGNAKLSCDQIEMVKHFIAAGRTNKWIASRVGVTHSMISRIRLGKNWTRSS